MKKKLVTPHNILISGTPDPNKSCPNYISPFPDEKKEFDKEIENECGKYELNINI